MGQELLFLLESLDHLLSHCSHLCQVCLWIQEALGAQVSHPDLEIQELRLDPCHLRHLLLQDGHCHLSSLSPLGSQWVPVVPGVQ